MTVHGRSYVEYWDTKPATGSYKWTRLDQGDLQRLELVDAVYQPLKVHMVISNIGMNHKLSDSSDTSSGSYTVEGEVGWPTFQRYQPIRILHNPRALYTTTVTHDSGTVLGAGTDYEITFTLQSHGLLAGDYIDMMNENTGSMNDGVYKIKAVTTNTFTLKAKDVAGTNKSNKWYVYDVEGTGTGTGTVVMVTNSQHMLYPIFFGRIDSVDVNYSDQVGKSISITASDYLANLTGEIITRSFITPPAVGEDFSGSSMEVGTEDGKYQDVSYDNAKLSDTVKELVADWSYGRELFSDNTYDGTNTLGDSKFEDSSHTFHADDEASVRRFAGRDTKVLDAVKNVAMTERHSAEAGADGGAGAPEASVYYWVDAGTILYGAAHWASAGETSKDIVVEEVNHGYVDGNMVNFVDGLAVSHAQHITNAAYIVSASTSNYFKIKNLQGDTIQKTVPSPMVAQACTISPGQTGSFGYDFYLDAGLYAANISNTDVNSHRPHLNYFLRGSRPIDPQATGLTLQYPQGYDETEDVFGWGLAASSGRINKTKVHLMPTFDHGMYAEDLYSHVGLRNVDTDDRKEGVGDLGHKMEMLKINSISNEDYVASMSSSWVGSDGREAFSGAEEGKGKFHWERNDTAVGLGWREDTEGTDNGRQNNIDYFDGTSAAFHANGTLGALAHNTRINNVDAPYILGGSGVTGASSVQGLGGLSQIPDGRPAITTGDSGSVQREACPKDMGIGRPFTDPPKTTAEKDGGRNDYGATALTAADLIKDVYNVELEGLLGNVVTAEHDASGLITQAGHTLETGNIIKITQINSSTSDVGGLTVNTAPTRANPDSDTTNTGSYYRVLRVSNLQFRITPCQTHRTLMLLSYGALGFTSSTTGSFHYRVAYNVFKHACRVQWTSGHTWSTETDDTVLRTTETGKGADYMIISDVRKADKPYKGIQVNALVENSPPPNLLKHPTAGVFGYTTVPHSTQYPTPHNAMPRLNEHTNLAAIPDAADAQFASDSKFTVRFLYGDYISETRFLYSDDDLTGVIGRNQAQPSNDTERTSKDVFKSVKAKILSRMVNHKNVSKTYTLQYNDSASSRDTVRDTVAQILKRVIIPSKRTTCKIFGYPTIKLTGSAQPGTGFVGGDVSAAADGDVLVPADNPVAYGARAGLYVEKTITLDGAPSDRTLANKVSSATIEGSLFGGDDWEVLDYYRIFIYLRAGNSVRVEHTAAGVTGNHIITKLTYYERLGTTETTIETTGYDEALLAQFGPLSELIATIKRSGDNWAEPKYVTVKKLSKNAFSYGD